jgi:hypothetical protein
VRGKNKARRKAIINKPKNKEKICFLIMSKRGAE